MGGKALKIVETRRIDREEFDNMSKILVDILKKDFDKVEIPMFYNSKSSFGDIDIVVSIEGFNTNFRTYIEETFKPTEIFHNGNAWSFDYEQTQIDLITTSNEHFESHLIYMGGNDLGNFIGRMAQRMGLKYGQEGLWYNHYSNGNQKDKIMISKDYPKIFKYLDLDYDKWIEGFDSLEEIFDYVKTSRYYSSDIFQMDQLNKINRERNAKRKSYMSFLEYIKDDNPDKMATYHMEKHKELLIDYVYKTFPESNIKLEVKRLEYEAAKSDYAKAKFNGKMIMDKYSLEGKELGDAIKYFKEYVQQHHPTQSYIDYIINTYEGTIFNAFEIAMGYKKGLS